MGGLSGFIDVTSVASLSRFSPNFALFHTSGYVNYASQLEHAHGLQDPRKGNGRGTSLNYNASNQNDQNDSDWGLVGYDETL